MPPPQSRAALRPRPAALLAPSLAVSLALFLGGLAVGWTVAVQRGAPVGPSAEPALQHEGAAGLPQAVTQVRGRPTAHSHPLLFCDDPSGDGRYSSVRGAVQSVIDRHVQRGAVTRAAVAVRDLESGAGFVLGGDDRYHPASLLKLPLAIAWMRRLQADPGALQRPLLYDMETLRESAQAPGALVTGQSYSAQDLLERMIRWSRNDAKAVLARELGDVALKAVYDDLAIPWPYGDPNSDMLLSVSDYSRLFRALYDASVVHGGAADQLLQLLARTEFANGLQAGMPPGTEFAHKWGMRLLPKPAGNERVHLHDCGIVYPPGRPLLLCAMSAGRSEGELLAALAEIGRAVWTNKP